MRRIGVDGRCLEGRPAGIGRYVYELCRVLENAMADAEFFVYSRFPLQRELFSARWHSRVEPFPPLRRLRGSLWLKLRCGSLARHDRLDLFWGTSTLLPQLPASVRKVVTVHDFNHLVVPETMGGLNLLAHRAFFAGDVAAADAVVTNSRATADRLKELLGREADAVVSPAAGSAFTPAAGEEIAAMLEKYGVRRPYLLAVATWEPRKNLELLVETYAGMKRSGGLPPEYSLLLVGGKGWKDRRLTSLAQENRDAGIVPLGYVADEDLPPLYSGATAFVFPSIYEGFGIPLMEARRCGATVVATDIPELRESGGAGGIFVPPTEEGIRRGIVRALSVPAPESREGLSSWEAEGAKLAEVLG